MTSETEPLRISANDPSPSRVLQDLQREAQAKGLEFYFNPPRNILPDFLGGYRPDAIALGPEGGIIIEIKHQRNRDSEKRLKDIAKRVSGKKGWEFRVIYLNPPIAPVPPIAKPTPQQVQTALREIETLIKGGHYAAALVTSWATLESLARLGSSHEEDGLKAISPLQAVQILAEEGYIENEAADRLRNLAQLRNAVVHGDFSAAVSAEQVKDFLRELRSIASSVLAII
jgi:hypothetical protein